MSDLRTVHYTVVHGLILVAALAAFIAMDDVRALLRWC
jgi:hypothetical protein